MSNHTTEIKRRLLDLCRHHIGQRIQLAEKMMNDAQDSANHETKSSVGDKYETGRAMMQSERDKHARQLAEAIQVEQLLERIQPEAQHQRVQLGSLVRTDFGEYFISISAGRLPVGDKKYYAISPATPLASAMLGKQKGETFSFNDKQMAILEVN